MHSCGILDAGSRRHALCSMLCGHVDGLISIVIFNLLIYGVYMLVAAHDA